MKTLMILIMALALSGCQKDKPDAGILPEPKMAEYYLVTNCMCFVEYTIDKTKHTIITENYWDTVFKVRSGDSLELTVDPQAMGLAVIGIYTLDSALTAETESMEYLRLSYVIP